MSACHPVALGVCLYGKWRYRSCTERIEPMSDSAVVRSAADRRTPPFRRRLPVGAEPMGDGRTDVRVWAPAASRVEIVLESRGAHTLARDADGYFTGVITTDAGE